MHQYFPSGDASVFFQMLLRDPEFLLPSGNMTTVCVCSIFMIFFKLYEGFD